MKPTDIVEEMISRNTNLDCLQFHNPLIFCTDDSSSSSNLASFFSKSSLPLILTPSELSSTCSSWNPPHISKRAFSKVRRPSRTAFMSFAYSFIEAIQAFR
eukprot:20629_1